MNVLEFVAFDSNFLELSWTWLNDPEIKRLTLTPSLTRQSQAAWFASLANRTDYFIRGLLCDGAPIGAVGFKHATSEEAEYWGYIGNKDYWGRGLGGQMVDHVIMIAKGRGFGRLYLKVAPDNIRAVRLYERKAFVRTDEKLGILTMSRPL